MLEYEKKLHLDKRWAQIQSRSVWMTVFRVLLCIICYSVIYLGLKWALEFVPDWAPWPSSDAVSAFGVVPLTIADTVYFCIGFLVFLYGCIRYYGINKQNHSVRKGNDTPDALLTTGYYSRVRHPMYGVFVLRFAAVMLSLRSVIGIILMLIFAVSQYLNAFREEKRVLIPLFNESYRDYANHVRHLLLKPGELIALILLSAMSLAGLCLS